MPDVIPQQDLNYPSQAPTIEMGVVTDVIRNDELSTKRSLFLHCGWVTLGWIQKLIVTDPLQPSGDLDPADDETACADLDSLAEGADPVTIARIPLYRWLKDKLDAAILLTP